MTSRLTGFFQNNVTSQIAQDILGCELTYRNGSQITSGLIVEAEAYLGEEDSTAHAYKGHRSLANEALYADPGTIYIYSLYGHLMINLVTQKRDVPQGILLRGLQPIRGIDLMKKNRSQTGFNLSNGPGKLTQALGITSKQLNLASIFDSALTMKIRRSKIPRRIVSSPRINVSKRGAWTDKQLRFYVSGNPYVSEMNKSNIDYKNYGWI